MSPRNIQSQVPQYFKDDQKPTFRVCTIANGSKGKSPQKNKDFATRSENIQPITKAQTVTVAPRNEGISTYRPSKRALKLVKSAQPNNIQLREQIRNIEKNIDKNIKEIQDFVESQQNKIIDDFLIFKDHMQKTMNE